MSEKANSTEPKPIRSWVDEQASDDMLPAEVQQKLLKMHQERKKDKK